VKQRLSDINEKIKRACEDAKRDPSSVTLIAVTKYTSVDKIKQALDLGLRHFGENRVQDACERWPALKAKGVTLHMIGPLQSNKVKQSASLFDVLHTLDRVSLAEDMLRADWTPPCFVQVNTGEEAQKSGVSPQDLDALLRELPFAPQGLMCIPPQNDPPSLHFALLATLAGRHGLTQLSMGMTADFEAAIRCGATHIRLGSALFDD
jgi:pyridoxal phosphate enzyme (YggS family)